LTWTNTIPHKSVNSKLWQGNYSLASSYWEKKYSRASTFWLFPVWQCDEVFEAGNQLSVVINKLMVVPTPRSNPHSETVKEHKSRRARTRNTRPGHHADRATKKLRNNSKAPRIIKRKRLPNRLPPPLPASGAATEPFFYGVMEGR
jgi:hypothetical protein